MVKVSIFFFCNIFLAVEKTLSEGAVGAGIEIIGKDFSRHVHQIKGSSLRKFTSSAIHLLCYHQEHEAVHVQVLSYQSNNTLKFSSASTLRFAGGSVASGSTVILALAPAVPASSRCETANISLRN